MKGVAQGLVSAGLFRWGAERGSGRHGQHHPGCREMRRPEAALFVNVRGGASWTRGAANFPRSSDIEDSPGAYRTRLRNDSGWISTTWSLGGSRRSDADGGGRGERIRGSLAAVRTWAGWRGAAEPGGGAGTSGAVWVL